MWNLSMRRSDEDDSSERTELHNKHIHRPPCGLVDTHSTSTSVPETAEKALYLLEVARADLEVCHLEKDLAERLLHQLRMREHYLKLQADKAKRNLGLRNSM
ncbi:hypothetical protein K503DRAFT_767002 [Rhizopogon vinicolor AM-OR11-026]|uniref:Uncharacterized protein n=1 Tax=Rhizopogon vinicolor AM-OR11-026 TaxID=1314800 RepID=A0A1B7NBC1_9AGAM|nr:hypothetical protein K503DRAFT_767002 [Rhizopogon vinicolor AM-OR11-026]